MAFIITASTFVMNAFITKLIKSFIQFELYHFQTDKNAGFLPFYH